MIDIDSLEWEGDIHDQEAMLAHAVEQLPIEFQSVTAGSVSLPAWESNLALEYIYRFG